MNQQSTFVQMPLWETGICASLWIFLAARSWYAVFEASRDYQHYITYALEPGSSLYGRNKDVSDMEWSLWSEVMADGFYMWLIGQVVLGQLIICLGKQKNRAQAFAVYGLLAVCTVISVRPVLTSIAHLTVLCAVACFTASSLCVWIISVLFLLSFNMLFTQTLMIDYAVISESGSMLPEYGICMSLVRSTSAALYICDVRSRQFSGHSKHNSEEPVLQDGRETLTTLRWRLTFNEIVDILCYVFYLPLFFSGPLMTYDNFHRQFNMPLKPLTWTQWSSFLRLGVRVIFWMIMFEIIIHFFYAAALLNNIDAMRVMPLWAVGGVGYVQGQLFMVKYFVVFGGFCALSQLDQLQTPGPPRCISYIYRYSQMWKSFDRGLYDVMLRHIYIPLGGSRHGHCRRAFASLMCFAYICVWHGMWHNVVVWVAANFIGVTVEAIGDQMSKTPRFRQFEAKFLSPASSQRLRSVCTIPLTALSEFAIFTFFSNTSIGCLIFDRLIVTNSPTTTLFLVVGVYAFIQTSKEIARLQMLRHKKLKSS